MKKNPSTKKQGFKPGMAIKAQRKIAKLIASAFMINGKTRWGNEFIQAIDKNTSFENPINNKRILKVVAGHGRLHWRYNETPILEQETNKWIEGFTNGEVFFDIGSNVGVYSLIAAQEKQMQTISFEIDTINSSIQHRNIHLNELQEKILLLTIGLSDETSVRDIYYKTISEGDALHSIDEISPLVDESNRKDAIKSKVITFKLDELVELAGLTRPKYIKIDVDGEEAKILKGMPNSLKTAESAMIEVDDKSYPEISKVMSNAGYIHETEYPVHGNSEDCRNILFSKTKN